MNYSQQILEKQIDQRKREISSILAKGHDVELRKDNGDRLKVIEVQKKIK